MNNELMLSGRLRTTVHDATTGRVLERRSTRNLVTLVGRNLVRDLLITGSGATLSHYAVGTGTTPAVAGDASLQNEVFRDVATQIVELPGEIEVTLYLSSTQANGNDITEAGIFTASSGGAMFARTVFPAINKTSNVAITFAHTISIGAS
jgi:hypothetical protein